MASSVFALVLFELARLAATLAFRYMPFNRDTALYAGFGTMLTVLFWVFVTASILLLGAEFGRALRAVGGARDRETATFLKPFR